MIRYPRHLAVLGVFCCLLCGTAGAQNRFDNGGGRGEPRGRGGAYEHAEPPRRPGGPVPDRREPGGGYGYPPPPYASPRYPAPPPRRPGAPAPGWSTDREEAPGLYQGRVAPLGWVIETIRRRSPGRELDAAVEVFEGRPVYRVLWITVHGRRMDFLVDAESGAIISGR